MKMILKLLLFLILALALILAGLLLYGTLTDYKPAEKITLPADKTGIETAPSELNIAIWNIGYCGLGQEMDFFYDGGKTVFGPIAWAQTNLKGISSEISSWQSQDFILLQEVDIDSKRSYKMNQKQFLNDVLPQHEGSLAINYKVSYLPFPFNKPLGKLHSGLVSFSKYNSIENTRYQFPGNYAWPKSMYLLDRCFLLQRYKTEHGKELVIINTHNSAYDDGSLKKKQMDYLKKVLLEEEAKGSYVIVGGDWNQIPADFNPDTFKIGEEEYSQSAVEADYMPGWTWAYDGTVATNRKLEKPYDPAKTFTTVIDYFLVSPNIEVTEVKGKDLRFRHSDHQPIFLKVRLN